MAKSASLVFLIAAFGFAVKANGLVKEGQGLAIAQCTPSQWVNGYPAGDNTGFCSQPASGNLSDVQNGATCTWTPTDTSGQSLVFTGVNVGCTQLGNIIFIYGRLTFPASAATSSVSIGGLPFTVANKLAAQSPGGVVETNAALSITAVPLHNTTNFTFNVFNGATGITDAQMSTAAAQFSFFYSTD